MRYGMVGRARNTTIGLVMGVMAIGATGAPTAAADTKGTIAIVNGRPGGKVDICLGRKELRSKARYGASVTRAEVGTGKKTIRFLNRTRADAGAGRSPG